MKHEIDLKNYQIRTDLLIETINEDIDKKEEIISRVNDALNGLGTGVYQAEITFDSDAFNNIN